MMRAFFVVMPAVFVAGPVALFDPVTAAIVAAGVVGIGLSATKARPERGEH